MAPQVDAAIATNAALKRNHLEIAGMRSTFSLTNLPGSVTSCLNDVPVKGLDESAARNLQADDCVRRDAPFRTRLALNGQTDSAVEWSLMGQQRTKSILARESYDAIDPSRTSCSVGLPIAVDRLRGFNPRDAKDRPGQVPDSVAHRNLLRVTNPPRS
jgi:hypothetical protein